MCVIFVCDKTKPTDEMISQAFAANKFGAGIAWREDKKVNWIKGVEEEEIQKLAIEKPLPIILHFRIPSCGGDTRRLCHPFPISKDVDLSSTGSTKGYVLFHNGHWSAYRNIMLESVMRGQLKVPGDAWSDSRVMAFLAFHYGNGFLNFIDEKIALMGPSEDDLEVLGPRDSWTRFNDVICSNMGWRVSTKKWNKVEDNVTGRRATPAGYHTTPPASLLPQRTAIVDDTGRLIGSVPADEGQFPPVQQPGGAAAESPFVKLCARDIQSVSEAQLLYKMNRISKTQKKKAIKRLEREADKRYRAEQLKKAQETMDQALIHH